MPVRIEAVVFDIGWVLLHLNYRADPRVPRGARRGARASAMR